MIGELPRSTEINGTEYALRTDFRDVLRILTAFSDPDLENDEKVYICLFILFEDFENMPETDYESAFKAAIRFIDCGTDPGEKHSPRTMDWEQDESIIFPAINRVAGYEPRSAEYIHWWTFMGWFMEIHDGVFSNVLSIRSKKAKGKKLEKWEREFWQANKDICVLKPKLTEEEKAARDRLNALLG